MPLNELGQYPTKAGQTHDFSVDNQELVHNSINAEPLARNNFNTDKLESNHTNSAIFVIPILLGVTTATMVYRRLNRVKPVILPCKICQFFNNNNYLKCAVNPTDVMTKKSLSCREYCPQSKKLFGFTWKHRHKN